MAGAPTAALVSLLFLLPICQAATASATPSPVPTTAPTTAQCSADDNPVGGQTPPVFLNGRGVCDLSAATPVNVFVVVSTLKIDPLDAPSESTTCAPRTPFY